VRRALSGKPLRPRSHIGRKPEKRGLRADIILTKVVIRFEPKAVSRLGTTEDSLVKYFVENQKKGNACFRKI